MNYIDEIFTRADIHKIRGFLLNGVEENTDQRSYIERIESAHDKFYERLKKDYPDRDEFEKISGLIYNYVSVTEDVYMEIGLQVGAILAAQTARNLKMALEGK